MIDIDGTWFDGLTSAGVEGRLSLDRSGYCRLSTREGQPILEQRDFSAQVSPRLGNTVRRIRFGEHGVFETADNGGVDEALALLNRGRWSGRVHRLESRLVYVLGAVVVAVVLGFLGVKYVVPATAELVAERLPEAVFKAAGEQALDVLDRTLLKPSELEPAIAGRVREKMLTVVTEFPELRLRVEFRKGGIIGPNALALPSGHIIFTDEMVTIAEHDNELIGVLAHEIGHVAHRHAMRRLLQDSFLSCAVLAITGDASGVSELFLGLPVMLTELAYSRAFEEEADKTALAYMKEHAIPLHHFSDMLLRISRLSGREKSDEKWTGYLSTHPNVMERIRAFTEVNQIKSLTP